MGQHYGSSAAETIKTRRGPPRGLVATRPLRSEGFPAPEFEVRLWKARLRDLVHCFKGLLDEFEKITLCVDPISFHTLQCLEEMAAAAFLTGQELNR